MATVQGLYIALLGRPADPRGLAFFQAATDGGTNLAAVGPLDNSAEYQSRFADQTITQIINAIHHSLFNREAPQQRLASLAEAVSAGAISVNDLAIALIDGARGDDLAILRNKLAAADAFTAAIDTAGEIRGFVGQSAAGVARAFLASVDETLPRAATIENAVLRATGTAEIVPLDDRPFGLMLDRAAPALNGTDSVQHYYTSDIGNFVTAQSDDTVQHCSVDHALLRSGLPADPIWIA